MLVSSWAHNGEWYLLGAALAALSQLSPLSVSRSGDTITITAPTYSGGAVAVVYTATVDGVDATLSGLTLTVPSAAIAQTVRVTATATRAGFASAVSVVELIVPAVEWIITATSEGIVMSLYPDYPAPTLPPAPTQPDWIISVTATSATITQYPEA